MVGGIWTDAGQLRSQGLRVLFVTLLAFSYLVCTGSMEVFSQATSVMHVLHGSCHGRFPHEVLLFLYFHGRFPHEVSCSMGVFPMKSCIPCSMGVFPMKSCIPWAFSP